MKTYLVRTEVQKSEEELKGLNLDDPNIKTTKEGPGYVFVGTTSAKIISKLNEMEVEVTSMDMYQEDKLWITKDIDQSGINLKVIECGFKSTEPQPQQQQQQNNGINSILVVAKSLLEYTSSLDANEIENFAGGMTSQLNVVYCG